jgi:hypothetical protein
MVLASSCSRPPPSRRSPSITPLRSSAERFWLSFALASTLSMVISRPMIARSCFSMSRSGASGTDQDPVPLVQVCKALHGIEEPTGVVMDLDAPGEVDS